MKAGTQAALVLGVGYVLGRRRKLRTATVLAGAVATGGLASLGGAALRRGAKMVGSTEALSGISPQLADIAETVRGDLVDAGKAAAIAAVNNRIGSLTDTLHERAESLRNPAAGVAETAVRGPGRRSRRMADDQEPDGSAAREADEADEDEEPEERPVRGRRRGAPSARRRSGSARRADDADEDDLDEDDADEDDADEDDLDEDEADEADDAEDRPVRPARRASRGRPAAVRRRR